MKELDALRHRHAKKDVPAPVQAEEEPEVDLVSETQADEHVVDMKPPVNNIRPLFLPKTWKQITFVDVAFSLIAGASPDGRYCRFHFSQEGQDFSSRESSESLRRSSRCSKYSSISTQTGETLSLPVGHWNDDWIRNRRGRRTGRRTARSQSKPEVLY